MKHTIFAQYNNETIRVYQAYNEIIAKQAVGLQTFGDKFNRNRMTWIKPSFLWMMYRSGWASKEGQERVLAIDIKCTGFHYILEHAVPSTYKPDLYQNNNEWKEAVKHSEARYQWDPERDIYGNAIDRRSLQLGIRGSLVEKYINDWILKVTDITLEVKNIKESINKRLFNETMLPMEKEYNYC